MTYLPDNIHWRCVGYGVDLHYFVSMDKMETGRVRDVIEQAARSERRNALGSSKLSLSISQRSVGYTNKIMDIIGSKNSKRHNITKNIRELLTKLIRKERKLALEQKYKRDMAREDKIFKTRVSVS